MFSWRSVLLFQLKRSRWLFLKILLMKSSQTVVVSARTSNMRMAERARLLYPTVEIMDERKCQARSVEDLDASGCSMPLCGAYGRKVTSRGWGTCVLGRCIVDAGLVVVSGREVDVGHV